VSDALLRFDRVALVRGGRLLFDDLNLELAPGDALHLAGPNGSGKSSMIRLAAGLLQAAQGRVERVAAALSDDSMALDRELPLRRALSFWTGPEKVHGAIEAFGIAHLSDVRVRLLSTGQVKRASLARVAACPAQLWLLDEPVNGLDADGIERLGKMIAGHRKAGGAVLAASHVALPGDWRRLELGR